MKINEYYKMSIEDGYFAGFLLVQLLVYEKKKLSMTDDVMKMEYFLQKRFKVKMNEELQKLADKFDNQIPR